MGRCGVHALKRSRIIAPLDPNGRWRPFYLQRIDRVVASAVCWVEVVRAGSHSFRLQIVEFDSLPALVVGKDTEQFGFQFLNDFRF